MLSALIGRGALNNIKNACRHRVTTAPVCWACAAWSSRAMAAPMHIL
jgi:hypothetical protein